MAENRTYYENCFTAPVKNVEEYLEKINHLIFNIRSVQNYPLLSFFLAKRDLVNKLLEKKSLI